MNPKSVIKFEKPLPHTIQQYSTQTDQIIQKNTVSSFLQVNSHFESQSKSSNPHFQKDHFKTLTSVNQMKSKIIVQNLCQQIKYLIQGNLKNDQLTFDMTEIVRDNIIPMLIKMFFQQPVQKQGGFFSSDKMSSTFESKDKEKQDKSLGTEDLQVHSVESFQATNNHSKLLDNNFPKSEYISQIPNSQIQIDENQESSFQLKQIQKIEKERKQKEQLSKLLFLTIVLLKFQVVKKAHCFQKLKSFSKKKERNLKQFISLFRQMKIKYCLQKFRQNFVTIQKQKNIQKAKEQSLLFKNKTSSLACQVFSKILKRKINSYFNLFKQNSLNDNKWIKQWVRIAALKSPITLKTSIWRLKNFLQNSYKKDQVQKYKEKQSVENKQSYKQFETSIKNIINSEDVQMIIKQPSSVQATKKSFKKSQGNFSQKQSSQQSISSGQFDAMFQSEESQSKISSEKAMKKNDNEIQNSQYNKDDQKKKQNPHSLQQEDGYLNTISEDQNEIQSVCE